MGHLLPAGQRRKQGDLSLQPHSFSRISAALVWKAHCEASRLICSKFQGVSAKSCAVAWSFRLLATSDVLYYGVTACLKRRGRREYAKFGKIHYSAVRAVTEVTGTSGGLVRLPLDKRPRRGQVSPHTEQGSQCPPRSNSTPQSCSCGLDASSHWYD